MSSFRSNALALALGVLGSLLLLLGIELFYRAFLFQPRGVRWDYPEGYETFDPVSNTATANPGRHRVTMTDTDTGEQIYDVTYTIDEYGRRVVPAPGGAQPDDALLFVGGSYTFGEGLADGETLPGRVAALVPDRRVYSYSFHGLGPFDLLAKLEVLAEGEVPETVREVIYVYIDNHIRRVVGSSATADWHRRYAYYATGPDGELVRDGSFESARPLRTRLLRLLGKSTLLLGNGIWIPTFPGEEGIRMVGRAIAQMQRTVARRLPGSRFVMLIYPGARTGREVARALDGTGAIVLDYTDLFEPTDPEFHVAPKEHHPSARAHEVLAPRIVADLGLD